MAANSSTSGTGVVGNTQNKKASATTSRTSNKQSWAANVSRTGIGLILLAVVIVLSVSKLGLWWNLVAAYAAYKAGSKLEGVKHHLIWQWPSILKVGGGIAAAVALLSSGIGLWTGSVVEDVNTAALCRAEPGNQKCAMTYPEKFCAIEKNKNDAVCLKKTTQERAEADAKAQPNATGAVGYRHPQVQAVQYPITGNCVGQFAEMPKCVLVTLKGDARFPYQADVGYRTNWNPQELVTVTDYGMGSIDVQSKHGGLVRVSVFQSKM